MHDRVCTGVNWDQVAADVDVTKHYAEFVDPTQHKPGWLRRTCIRAGAALYGCLCSCRRRSKDKDSNVDVESPSAGDGAHDRHGGGADGGANGVVHGRKAPRVVEMDEATVDGTSVEMTTQMSAMGGSDGGDVLDTAASGIFGQAKSLCVIAVCCVLSCASVARWL